MENVFGETPNTAGGSASALLRRDKTPRSTQVRRFSGYCFNEIAHK